jgi:hypothetical protein
MLMRSHLSFCKHLSARALCFVWATLLASPVLNAQSPSAANPLSKIDVPTSASVSGAIEPGIPMKLSLAFAGSNVQLDLQPLSYRAADFKLEVIEKGQSRFVDPGPVRTVQGAITDMPGSRILGVIKPSGLALTITLADGKMLDIAPSAQNVSKSEQALYTITPRAEISRPTATANTIDDRAFAKSNGQDCASLGRCGARIVFDTDSVFYSFNGSSNQGVMASVDLILAQINQRYEILKIRHELAGVRVRANTADDPYDDRTWLELSGPLDLRDLIRSLWIDRTAGLDIDLVHLLTGAAIRNGGQAPIGGICSDHNKYSYSRNLGGTCGDAVMTTHELGHSWGSQHTLTGIMRNASVSCSDTWDAQSTAWITYIRDAADGFCLDLIPPKRARIFDLSLPTTMEAGKTYSASVKLENTGVLPWSPVGAITNAYRLAQVGSPGWQPTRIELPSPLAVGARVMLTFNVTAPATGGVHNFQLQMVHEDVAFFGDPSVAVAVTVL